MENNQKRSKNSEKYKKNLSVGLGQLTLPCMTMGNSKGDHTPPKIRRKIRIFRAVRRGGRYPCWMCGASGACLTCIVWARVVVAVERWDHRTDEKTRKTHGFPCFSMPFGGRAVECPERAGERRKDIHVTLF